MENNKLLWEEFLALYQTFPCLWDSKSKTYSDRNLRNAALQELVNKCKEITYFANKEYVTKKIHNFRCGFRRELKKVKASMKTGTSADDRYVPTLWYFDMISFIADTEVPRKGTESVESGSELDEAVPSGDVSNEVIMFSIKFRFLQIPFYLEMMWNLHY